MSTVKVSQKIITGTSKQGVKAKIMRKASNDYSCLSWNSYFDSLEYLENGTSLFKAGSQDKGPIVICLHGAGQSALTYACLAQHLKTFAQVYAFDFRGHGESKFQEQSTNFSVETLVKDAIKAIKYINSQAKAHQGILLVGHSLGGAIAIRVAAQLIETQEFKNKIKGLFVIESIEGTAIEFMPMMAQIISEKPQEFSCIEQAIAFSYKASIIKNLQSARISVPEEIVYDQERKTYKWKVDLLQSQQYWLGWFQNLNNIFLNLKIPKLLLISDKEKLDKDLIIAQMQGKFQMNVIQNANHNIHEDAPLETAKILSAFCKRYQLF